MSYGKTLLIKLGTSRLGTDRLDVGFFRCWSFKPLAVALSFAVALVRALGMIWLLGLKQALCDFARMSSYELKRDPSRVASQGLATKRQLVSSSWRHSEYPQRGWWF